MIGMHESQCYQAIACATPCYPSVPSQALRNAGLAARGNRPLAPRVLVPGDSSSKYSILFGEMSLERLGIS